jgi:peptide/nickel transport system permease protein
LALGPIAQEARITRASVVENLNKDYILASISHGIPERLIVLKYLMRPSLIPTVSILGLDIASLMGWAFLVESIFNWPGMSRYGIIAMLRKDLNAIVGVVMVTGLVFAIANIVVDIIVSLLDPRIRMVERAK